MPKIFFAEEKNIKFSSFLRQKLICIVFQDENSWGIVNADYIDFFASATHQNKDMFYGISTTEGYLMPNPIYTYILII